MIKQIKHFLCGINDYFNYDMKIRNKMLVSFSFVSIVPLLLFSQLSYLRVSKTLKKNTQDSATQLLLLAASYLDDKTEAVLYARDQIFYDSTLLSIISDDQNSTITPDSYQDFVRLTDILKRVNFGKRADNITLFLKNYPFTSSATPRPLATVFISDYGNAEQEDWYKKLQASNGTLLWLPSSLNANSTIPGEPVVSAVQFLNKESDYSEHIAILRIDTRAKDYAEIVQKTALTPACSAYLLDKDGVSILPGTSSVSCPVAFDQLPKASSEPSWATQRVNGQKFLVGTIHISATDWTLVSVVPYSTILKSSTQARLDTLLMAGLICIFTYIATYFVSYSTTRRISLLTREISKVRYKDDLVLFDDKGKDEVSELIKSYNYLTERIRVHYQMQFESGKAVKHAELRALQAQINPHFLYNTLELVNWIAISKNSPEISDIVIALSKYYKLSLNRGKEYLSVQDELQHIQIYVKLQNYRFQNSIHLEINVDDRLLPLYMPNLILQPIVENAILHGIAEKQVPVGTICVSGTLHENIATFHVTDDGIGMSQAQLEKLVDFDAHKDFGYGLYNVNQRIKLLYGNSYGLHIESLTEKGTDITITFPCSASESIAP